MTIGKPISRIVVNSHKETVDLLIERGWMERGMNDVSLTEFGELVCLGLMMNFFRISELPDYEGNIDASHSKYLFGIMNTAGVINTHRSHGEDLANVSDEGAQFCIKMVDAAIRDGYLEDVLELAQEDRIRGLRIVNLNEAGKKR